MEGEEISAKRKGILLIAMGPVGASMYLKELWTDYMKL